MQYVTLTYHQERERQWHEALGHRDLLGMAKGVVISEEGVTPEDAFRVLKARSQRGNRKLYVVAREVVDEAVDRNLRR